MPVKAPHLERKEHFLLFKPRLYFFIIWGQNKSQQALPFNIPYMILQPAVKHGKAPSSPQGSSWKHTRHATAAEKAEFPHLQTEDTKARMSQNTLASSKALPNVMSRAVELSLARGGKWTGISCLNVAFTNKKAYSTQVHLFANICEHKIWWLSPVPVIWEH